MSEARDAGETAPRPSPPEPEPPPATEPPPAPEAAVARDDFERRHPHALRLELTIGAVVLGVLTLAVLLFTTLLVVLVPLSPWLMAAALALPLVLAVPFLLVPRWRHQRYRYRANDRGIEIRQGIWWRSHRFIPHTRLQHTDIAQGPLERRFDLANLVIHTAGTHAARTTVSGLSVAAARLLRDRLTAEIDESAAGADGV